MINMAEAVDILSLKNDFMTNSKPLSQINGRTFSDILSSEKKNLLSGGQNTTKCIKYDNQNKTGNFTDQIGSQNNTGKPRNETKPVTGDTKTFSDKTKQPKECEDAGVDKTIEDAKEEPAEKDVALSLWSILSAMLENIFELENMDGGNMYDENMEIDAGQLDQLQNLGNLKELLLSLSETTDTLMDDSLKQMDDSLKQMDDFLKQNVETIIELADKTNEKLLLRGGEQLTGFEPESDETSDCLDQLKNSIQVVLDELNADKPAGLQKLHIKNNTTDPEEEQSAEGKETSIAIDNMGKDTKDSAKIAGEAAPDDREEQFSKQFEKGDEILFKEQVIVPQQKIDEQIIDLKTVREQIMEPRQFISEIAQKAGTFILRGRNEMSIQLIPENLGKISIKIGLNDGTLTGKIYAENYSVKATIEANLDQLKDSLEEQGLNIAGLEVHIDDSSQNLERGLQPNFAGRQKSKIGSIKTNGDIAALEQDIDEINPYLRINQFDSLV